MQVFSFIFFFYSSDQLSISNLINFNQCWLIHLCLSGCITSAETVMLEKQSLGDFIDRINSDKAVIVSVSPQSRASLAAFFGLSQSQVTTWACHIHSPVRIMVDTLLQVFTMSYLFSINYCKVALQL
jgi:iron only hydrogenase large subunit-like protein